MFNPHKVPPKTTLPCDLTFYFIFVKKILLKKLLLFLLPLPIFGFGQNVNIPDSSFKAYLVGNKAINTNRDKEIQISEASAFNDTIDCRDMSISNLKGIEAFTTLTYLDCKGNQLTSLDVSKNTALTVLDCSYNPLTSLDVSKNSALYSLLCYANQLISLNISGASALSWLNCGGNQLTSLDLSKNSALTELGCFNNQFSSLDLSKNTSLTWLNCGENQLSSLDLSRNTSLTYLECGKINLIVML